MQSPAQLAKASGVGVTGKQLQPAETLAPKRPCRGGVDAPVSAQDTRHEREVPKNGRARVDLDAHVTDRRRHSCSMGEVHDFILQRANEDASLALASMHKPDLEDARDSRALGPGPTWGPHRVLRESEIKIEIASNHDDGACQRCVVSPGHGCETIRLLAQSWSYHPGYRSEWQSFHDGDYQLSPPMASEIFVELSHTAVTRSSDGEMQVLRLLAEGLGYREIGKQLVVSPNTVKNHARNTLSRSRFLRRWGDGPGPAKTPA